jgi:hypothetical protein
MTAAKQFANRSYGQVAGIALIALAIVLTSAPSPLCALCSVGGKALHKVQQTEVGRELFKIYAQRGLQSHSL